MVIVKSDLWRTAMNRCIKCKRLVDRKATKCRRCYLISKEWKSGPAVEEPPLSEETTNAFPGSEEKQLVMQKRVSMGMQVFHPRDGIGVDSW